MLFGKYWWLALVAIVIILALAAVVQYTKDTNVAGWVFTFLSDWAIILSATVTLLLVIAAFLTIRNVNEREKRRREEELSKERRDRDERLLNEIIEWAIGISKANLELDKTILASQLHSHWVGRVSLPQLQSLFQEMYERGKYVIASANILSTPLFNIVKPAQEKIDKIIMTLDQSIIVKAQKEAEVPELTKSEAEEIIDEDTKFVKPVQADLKGIIDIDDLGSDRQKLVDLVNEVIKEATKIKTRGIG